MKILSHDPAASDIAMQMIGNAAQHIARTYSEADDSTSGVFV